jgi:HEAT repeat protein
MRYAKGAGNPDLQLEAIRYLGARRVGTTGSQLREIYESTTDTRVKLAVIDAFRSGGDKTALLQMYVDKKAPVAVRKSIVSRLGGLANADDVLALYRQETDTELKLQLLSVLGVKLGTVQLAQIARSDVDKAVRTRAVWALAGQRNEATTAALVELYDGQPDREVRRAVIEVLSSHGSAEALVTLAKRETDVELKRDLVRRLSAMAPKSKAAADYLMEQLR